MNNKTIQLAVIACLAVSMQACSIPLLNLKKADTKLPEQFANRQASEEN